MHNTERCVLLQQHSTDVSVVCDATAALCPRFIENTICAVPSNGERTSRRRLFHPVARTIAEAQLARVAPPAPIELARAAVDGMHREVYRCRVFTSHRNQKKAAYRFRVQPPLGLWASVIGGGGTCAWVLEVRRTSCFRELPLRGRSSETNTTEQGGYNMNALPYAWSHLCLDKRLGCI